MTQRTRLVWMATATALLLAGGCERKVPAPPAPPATSVAPAPAAAIDAARLAAGEPDQWLTPGRDPNGTYFSPLTDVNAGNIAQLGFAWDYRLGTGRGLEGTPLVGDGGMYASGNFRPVSALDAGTGRDLRECGPRLHGRSGRPGGGATGPRERPATHARL